MPTEFRRSRRRFLQDTSLLGVGLVIGAGCTSGNAAETSGVDLVRLFSSDNVVMAGREQRLAFGLISDGRTRLDEESPASVRVLRDGRVVDEVVVPGQLVVHDHPGGDADVAHEHADIARYFPLRTTLPDPGIYDLEVEIDGIGLSLAVQAFAAENVQVLSAGEPFPPLDTPTLAAPEPLDTICTLVGGPCPFHTRTVREVLDAGEPLAFLIASPAYCSTSYCGPVLDELIAAAAQFPTVTPLHLEVYENPAEVGGNIADPAIRPVAALADLGLEFEPSLFLVDRSGITVDRIDNVYNREELEAALAAIA